MWWIPLALADGPPRGTGDGLRQLTIEAGFDEVAGATGAPLFVEHAAVNDKGEREQPPPQHETRAASEQGGETPPGGFPDAGPAIVGSGSSTEKRGFTLQVEAPAGATVVAHIGEFEAALSEDSPGVHTGEIGRYPVGPALRIRVDDVEVFTSDIELDDDSSPPTMQVRYQ